MTTDMTSHGYRLAPLAVLMGVRPVPFCLLAQEELPAQHGSVELGARVVTGQVDGRPDLPFRPSLTDGKLNEYRDLRTGPFVRNLEANWDFSRTYFALRSHSSLYKDQSWLAQWVSWAGTKFSSVSIKRRTSLPTRHARCTSKALRRLDAGPGDPRHPGRLCQRHRNGDSSETPDRAGELQQRYKSQRGHCGLFFDQREGPPISASIPLRTGTSRSSSGASGKRASVLSALASAAAAPKCRKASTTLRTTTGSSRSTASIAGPFGWDTTPIPSPTMSLFGGGQSIRYHGCDQRHGPRQTQSLS